LYIVIRYSQLVFL